MKSYIFTSALAIFSALVAAVPTPVSEPDSTAVIEARAVTTITPSLLVRLWEAAPDTPDGQSTVGESSRWNNKNNVQTLVAFNFATSYAGHQCQLAFYNPDYIYAYGSSQAQVFTVGGPITQANTFNSRPYRDQHKGTFTAYPYGSGFASWVNQGGNTFDCPTGPTTLGYEVVPVGDNDAIYWTAPRGLVILVL